ncbi:DUF302 domain-containing protein [Planktotalea arctica]|uniref:DUF302 domain-containing protein n=1 Tax=Planktotalea arctica TaxID=1481893 RepID=UPI000A16E7FF|nr:DUF302 domain-containing protein [Planktotalea arctica]
MTRISIAAAFALTLATPLLAQATVTYTSAQSFDDVVFGLESAILDQGLVIDSTSHVGDMLERTKADVGSDRTLFLNADVYSFCSASLSRKVMEADPMNIQFCPYGIFVMVSPDRPNETTIGYRTMPEGAMKEVEALLDSIAKTAIGHE